MDFAAWRSIFYAKNASFFRIPLRRLNLSAPRHMTSRERYVKKKAFERYVREKHKHTLRHRDNATQSTCRTKKFLSCRHATKSNPKAVTAKGR